MVARRGALAANVALGGRAHHRADFQTLGGIAGVVHFVHQAGGQADLIAVGAVARSRGSDQFALGQLAGHGIGHRHQRISRAGYAHCLVDVCAAGQGVADRAADTGGRAAEGLDLGGMVVRFIFKHQEPWLGAPVHIHVDFDGAGVDFLALVQVAKLPGLFERLCADGGDIHKVHGPGSRAARPVRVDAFTQGQIPLERLLNRGLVDFHTVQRG